MKKFKIVLLAVLLASSLFLNGCVIADSKKTEIKLTCEDKTELAEIIAKKVVELQNQQQNGQQ